MTHLSNPNLTKADRALLVIACVGACLEAAGTVGNGNLPQHIKEAFIPLVEEAKQYLLDHEKEVPDRGVFSNLLRISQLLWPESQRDDQEEAQGSGVPF